MALKIIRSRKSFATLSNQRSFVGLHKNKPVSGVDAVRAINDKLRKDRDSRIKTKT